MILGRNPALWLGLLQALLNALVALNVVTFTLEQLTTLNIFGGALVGIIANSADPTTAGTFSLTTKAPASGSVTKTG